MKLKLTKMQYASTTHMIRSFILLIFGYEKGKKKTFFLRFKSKYIKNPKLSDFLLSSYFNS